MFRRTLTFATVLALSAVTFAQSPTPAPQKADAPKSKTLQAIQGTWVFTNANGQDATGQPEVLLTLTDNKYVQTAGGQFLESGTFTIDETKKPIQIEIKVLEGKDAGQTQYGIFELTSPTEMKCKVNDAGVLVKPTDFTMVEGSFVFTAVKKK